MSEINNGGPAFPTQELPQWSWPGSTGMSLRDWFAGQALSGLLSGFYRTSTNANLAEVPAEAYAIADAMLAERAKAEGR